jgi:RNA 2',3'-cyclic 3'-phosphodiesterase
MLRLFVALELPDEVKQRVAPLAGGLPDARWVARENLHITLRFIGEVDEDTAEDVGAALGTVHSQPVEIALAGVGCWESKGRVRQVWSKVKAGDELGLLQSRVESSLKRVGLDPDGRKFTPHVTVARLKGVPSRIVAPYLEYHGSFRAGPFTADHFTLFQSRMGHGGSHYEALARYELAR